MADTYDDFEVVCTYTIKDMLEDGMLFDLSSPKVGPIPVYAPVFSGIRYITSALLYKGYIEGDTFNRPNLADLLVQVSKGIRKGMAQGEDRLFEQMVEFPDGHREKVWALVNEEGSLTLMLPSDY
ncbi:MAG: hypothetical protein KKG10_07245 [Proteobacteria bacterium]|nr:hypothetical protein [Pseudomonadota bacterium]